MFALRNVQVQAKSPKIAGSVKSVECAGIRMWIDDSERMELSESLFFESAQVGDGSASTAGRVQMQQKAWVRQCD